DLVADLQLGERLLERRVAQPRTEAEHALLGRRRRDGDVPAQALLVLVAAVGQLDPEVLPRAEVDPLAVEVEDDEQRPLRDLPALLPERAHAGRLSPPPRQSVSTASAGAPSASSCATIGRSRSSVTASPAASAAKMPPTTN